MAGVTWWIGGRACFIKLIIYRSSIWSVGSFASMEGKEDVPQACAQQVGGILSSPSFYAFCLKKLASPYGLLIVGLSSCSDKYWCIIRYPPAPFGCGLRSQLTKSTEINWDPPVQDKDQSSMHFGRSFHQCYALHCYAVCGQAQFSTNRRYLVRAAVVGAFSTIHQRIQDKILVNVRMKIQHAVK